MLEIQRSKNRRRSGFQILEFALILPVLLMMTLGMIILGLGVSQYQIVATLAREGARYASVRGAGYAQTTSKPAATEADINAKIIQPRAVALGLPGCVTTVTWTPNNKAGSQVAVNVRLVWVPAAYLGTVNMSSTAVMTIAQ